MVSIKKIEMVGFKTFARKTSITLDKGLNVIMGPNGSGKTNVVDAIQFVLGELSVRTLRATNFAALLFSGNSEIPKARHATVTLHFSNTARKIPLDTDVVAVSRYVGADGVSIYRVNGRKYSRANLIDSLSVASITGGTNIITQGTTMRIADFNPEDRRQNIETIIGIAEYDRKKQQAQVELREAEMNLKVASGKFEEVKKRLIELEKERNDLIRYNYVKTELNRLKATTYSAEIKTFEVELTKLNRELEAKSDKLAEYNVKLDELESKRLDKQKEWQEYTTQVEGKGGDELVSLQKQIGDLNSEISGLKVTISSSKTMLKSYENMLKDKLETYNSIKEQFHSAKHQLKKTSRSKEELSSHVSEKVKVRENILNKIDEIKKNLNENAAKLSNIEEQITALEREEAHLTVKTKAEREKCEILEEQIATLTSRKESYNSLFQSFSERLKQVNSFKDKEYRSLNEVTQSLEKVKKQIVTSESEIRNAEKIVRRASLSVTEFTSRKDLADVAFSEEKALEHIENLSKLKAISGVYGKLGQKIRMIKYKHAIDAATEGWLQALIVEDMDIVRLCAETLKRAKIGRVKLLPLANLQSIKSIENPKLPGIYGSASSFVVCATKYRPAVNFVLGDTLIAQNTEFALAASKQGYRVVTEEGEVFQPGLRLEVGYYREPIDLSNILPSDDTIKRISATVSSFEKLLESKKADLKRLNDDLLRLETEKILHEDTVKYFERETTNLSQNNERTHKGIVEINRKLRSLNTKLENSRDHINEAEDRLSELEKQLHTLRVEAATLRRKLKPETITELRSENAQIEAEINELNRQITKLDGEISNHKSNIQNIFLSQLNTIKKELDGIKQNIKSRHRDVVNSTHKLDQAISKIKMLEAETEKLTAQISVKKEEHKKFVEAVEEINSQIKKTSNEMSPLNDIVNNLKQNIFKIQLEIEHGLKELKMIGYDQIIDFKPEEHALSKSLLESLQEDFNGLSERVNMNAIVLYEPQKENYKQLSVRINQLEGEKSEIIRFMENLERQKKDTFFAALEKLNAKFSETFNAITQGRGWLQLQNPDDPFTGGLDIIVEFPGKSLMPITAASGGEKSVVAVCYIFALQSLLQSSPFYIFDEVDAHLDPVNVQRLADLLSKEAESSQLIVISFKESIAAKANRIFGVYGRNGVSNVCSLPLIGVQA